MTLSTLRNSRSSSNNSNIIFRYAVPTAAVMLILSFALKTADQIFYSVFAVLILAVCGFFAVYFKNLKLLLFALVIVVFSARIISLLSLSQSLYKYDAVGESIVAVVTTTPVQKGEDHSNYAYCTVLVKESEENRALSGSKLLLNGDEVGGLSLGDKITAEVELSPIGDTQNHLSFYSENVFLSGKLIDTPVVDKDSKSIYSFSFEVRQFVQNVLVKNTDNFGILLAIITGERSYIDDNFYEQVKIAGVSHILVVSGMHFAVLCGAVIKLLAMIKIPNILKDVFLILFLFVMMCICGFGMSILRASTVYVISILYRWLNRLSNSFMSLACAVIVVLFIHPFAVFSIAFLLSFASTFGILVLSNRITYIFEKKFKMPSLLDFFIKSATVSFSAYIATLPIVVYYFGYISTYAVLTNVLISFVSTLMLILSAVGVLFSKIPFVSGLILNAADFLADYFVSAVKFVYNLPLATIPLRNEKALTVIILIAFAAIYVIIEKPYRILLKKR